MDCCCTIRVLYGYGAQLHKISSLLVLQCGAFIQGRGFRGRHVPYLRDVLRDLREDLREALRLAEREALREALRRMVRRRRRAPPS